MADLKDQLQAQVKGEVLDDVTTLAICSHDASIFESKPQVVVAPKDTEDIEKLVQFVTSHNPQLSLTARSAGTDMSGGAVNDSITLDMTKHFNRVLKVGEDFAVTQPGVHYRDFEAETLKHHLLLPCYPASRELCTVGGMAANNSAGEKTLSMGQTKKYVKKIKAVLSDGKEYTFEPLNKVQLQKKLAQKDFEGEIYRKVHKLIEANYDLIQKARPTVHKNSSGYLLWDVWDRKTFDISKLLVGSQGTLGIITEIEFRLIQPKAYSNLLVIFLKDLKNVGEIVNKVLTHQPESFESFDDYTLRVAMRFLPEVIKVFKPHGLISLLVQFLPEVWMSLTGGIPKLILIAEFTGDSKEEVERKCLEAQKDLSSFKVKTRITKSEDEARKYWVLRRESFNLLRHHSMGLRTAPFIDDIIVKPEFLPEFLPKLQTLLEEYKLVYTIAGHIGDGNFHIIPLMNFKDPQTREIIPELSSKVYKLVFEYHGSMSAEHNDGLVRGPYLLQMFGEKVSQLFKDVKRIFDPQDIFNPHKKADADLQYSLAHIVHTS
ncbi:MAG: FAD-binding oxidoreductase [bacterium]|nr:FAD-binding oxidoreductase [bacterium]